MAPQPHASGDIGSPGWKNLILSGAETMGVNVTGHQMDKIVRFGTVLCDWNKRVNLTAITDPEAIAVKHFLDSMAALAYIPETGKLLDIGSGGGFPGLVLAIFRPHLQITTIDSVRKKVSFLQYVIRTLNLQEVRADHTRAEALVLEKDRYDVIVSRALGSLQMFVALGLPLLAPEGTMIAYRGQGRRDDPDETKNPDLSVVRKTYRLPEYGDSRSLVFIQRI